MVSWDGTVLVFALSLFLWGLDEGIVGSLLSVGLLGH